MDTAWKRLFPVAGDSQLTPLSREHRDFSLLDDANLAISPAILLLFLTPFYLSHYSSQPVVTGKDPLLWAKAGTNAILIALQAFSGLLYGSSDGATGLSFVAASVVSLAAITLAILMHVEHSRTLEPSSLPALYTFVTMLLDIANGPLCLLRGATEFHSLGCIMTATAAFKVILLVLCELPKRYHGQPAKRGAKPNSGFWAQALPTWLKSTLFLGFQSVLSIDDLPDLDPSFASARLAATFEPIWQKRDSSPHVLLLSTLQAQAWSFLSVVPPRLLHTAFSFAEPLLLRRCLQQLGFGDQEPGDIRELIGAMALVQTGLAVTRAWYKRMNNRLATKARGILVSQVLRKSLLIGPHEAKRHSGTSLMSTDVEAIANIIPLLHDAWIIPLELGLSIYLLSRAISKAAFLVTLPAIVATALSLRIRERKASATQAWRQNSAKRVSITTQILTRMRGIKMIAAEDAISDYVASLRATEVGYLKRYNNFELPKMAALEMSYTLTPVVVVAGGLFWSGFSSGFTAVEVFTSLAFIFLASKPMAAIVNSWHRIGGLPASFDRIQSFLLLKERRDRRRRGPNMPQQNTTIPNVMPPQDIEHFPIQLVNATVASPNGAVLFAANLSVHRSSVTGVVGPSGAGKSSLMRAVLGEANVTGAIYIRPGAIAYCGEEEWLRNSTIRDNIIGENVYDEERYRAVVSACLLGDLEEFPQGDMTLTGPRGDHLSGGQRQRVALARAAYSCAQIVLFDNAFSALDRVSSSTVLKNLVDDDGLLRRIGATVVMSTHSVELLKSTDRVVVIHGDGSVTTRSPQSVIKKYEGQGFLDDFSDNSEMISDLGGRQEPAAGQNAHEKPKPRPTTSLRQYAGLDLYKYYLSSVHRSSFVMFLVIMVLHVVGERAPDVYMRIWLGNDQENKNMFIGYALAGACSMIISVLWIWSYDLRLVPESSQSLHRVLLNTISNASLSFLTYTDIGTLLSRFNQDMSLVMRDLPHEFLMFSYALFTALLSIGVLASTVKYAATLVPFLLMGLWTFQIYYLRLSQHIRQLDSEAQTPIQAHLIECSEGIHHIRAFQWEKNYLAKSLELLDKSQKPFYHRYGIQSWLSLVVDLTVGATGVLLASLGLNQGSTSQAAFGLGLLKVLQINAEFNYTMDMWVAFESSLDAISRIRAFENDTPKEGTGTGAGVDGNSRVPDNWPHSGKVEVNNVSADYTVDGADYRALHEVSVNIAPGTKVGLVGRSGSGKSTFLMTLLNLVKFSGSITIDGLDIATIPRHVLRSRITTISQELIDLPGSVRNNLLPQEMMKTSGELTSDTKILAALQKVGLKEIIERRGGLDKAVDEVGLSSGEQQLLALARALLHHDRVKGKLIFIDEATCHIDYESEAKLREVTTEAFEDCTVITIAHRYHTLNNTTLLELSAGHLVAYG